MPISSPDWLVQHGGDLKLATDGETWLVLFAGEPQYALQAVPVMHLPSSTMGSFCRGGWGRRLLSGRLHGVRFGPLATGRVSLRCRRARRDRRRAPRACGEACATAAA